MKCAVLIVLMALACVDSLPSEITTAKLSTTAASTPPSSRLSTTTTQPKTTRAPIGDSIKKLANQLMDTTGSNKSMPSNSGLFVLDTRTPPKIKEQQQEHMQKLKNHEKVTIEQSHAGVAIPVNEDELLEETTTKKNAFYKIERPTTTNGGLSTWILLSGQTTQAPKTTIKVKPVIKPNQPDEHKSSTENPNRVIKPLFKRRTTTTKKPTTVSSISKQTTSTTKFGIKLTTEGTKTTSVPTKLTKTKASELSSSQKKTNNVTNINNKKFNNTNNKNNTVTQSTTTVPINLVNSTNLPAEAKDGDVELDNSAEKKKKTQKRKKNKNRRRKPENEKENDDTNSTDTKIQKKEPKQPKEKPLGTQLYNYLSREVISSVGVGLVGLMVTAGLAGYFLYPIAPVRRNYEIIDRKDKEGSYYYNDEFSGGIAEEEAIGKVIAGMPANTLYGENFQNNAQVGNNDNYKTSRNTYPQMQNVQGVHSVQQGSNNNNNRYRNVDRRGGEYISTNTQQSSQIVKGSVESVPLDDKDTSDYDGGGYNNFQLNYQSNAPVTYQEKVPEINYDPAKQFVVGNIPKEFEDATPAAVPEHGPRSLRIRRDAIQPADDNLNEINANLSEIDIITTSTIASTTLEYKTTEKTVVTTNKTTGNSTTSLQEKYQSFVHLLKDLIHIKVKLGLELIQNATQSISKYVSKMSARLDENYKNYTKSRG